VTTRTTTSLVTGGAGFIGSHVARQLRDDGHDVIALDDLSGGFKENVPDDVEFVEASVLDAERIDDLVSSRRVDNVFHLAAYAAEGLSHFIRRFNYTNNVVGSMNVLNAALRSGTVETVVFTSSIAVYGAGQVPMTEDLVPAPEDPYGIAKSAVEQDLRAAKELFDLDFVIFRPHNVYGEHQHIGDRYRNVVGIFMNQAMRGEPFTVFGDGEQQRAFTHIADVAPMIARSVDVPAARGEVFNVGGDTVFTVNELARVVADAMEVELRIDHLPPRIEVRDAFSSHDKAWATFGRPAEPVGLVEGVRRMAAWARERGPQEPSIFEGIEVARNLPPSWALVAR
jgi:UDP-glucose 4-epimerase